MLHSGMGGLGSAWHPRLSWELTGDSRTLCDHDEHRWRGHPHGTLHYTTVTLQKRISYKEVLFLNGSAQLQERLSLFLYEYLMPKQTPALPPSQLVLPRTIRRQPRSFKSQVSAGRGASLDSLAISIAYNTPTLQLCRREHPQPAEVPAILVYRNAQHSRSVSQPALLTAAVLRPSLAAGEPTSPSPPKARSKLRERLSRCPPARARAGSCPEARRPSTIVTGERAQEQGNLEKIRVHI